MSFAYDSANDFFIESISKFGRIFVNECPSIDEGLIKTVNDFVGIAFDLLNNVKVRHGQKIILNSKSYLLDYK
jgi:hypothetical protein